MKTPIVLLLSLASIAFSVCAIEPGATVPRAEDLPNSIPPARATPDLQFPIPSLQEKDLQESTTVHFVLRSVDFNGNQVFDDAELRKVIESNINQSLSYIDLETLRFKLAEYYREKGYINSGVILPAQHIRNGNVQFQIIEGKLREVRIHGAERLSDAYLQTRLDTNSDQAFNKEDLLERFKILLDDPMIERLNGALQPGSRPGESMLDLEVTRSQPYELKFYFDNYTPPSVGAYTGRLNGTVRNLTGWGDFLQLDLNYSGGNEGLGTLFSLPLAAGETRLNLNFQGNHSAIIDAPLKSLHIENDFYHLSAGISHPLYKNVHPDVHRALTVEGQFAYRYSRSFILGVPIGLAEGSEENGEAKVSVFRFLQNYSDRANNRALSIRSTFSAGVGLLDATIHQQEADSRFFSWLGQARYIQRLNDDGLELFMRGDMQVASEALLSVECFALGGVYTVRGYRQNELVRDNGYAVSAELRYPLLQAENEQQHSLKLVPFVDYGVAWNDQRANRTLWSIGAGLQWQWRIVNADIYWAEAMNNVGVVNQQGDIQDNGIHFRLGFKLL